MLPKFSFGWVLKLERDHTRLSTPQSPFSTDGLWFISFPRGADKSCIQPSRPGGERVLETGALHRALLVLLGVLGGELLPAAPLQPCAEAPSGRGGYRICWTWLTWPKDIMPAMRFHA